MKTFYNHLHAQHQGKVEMFRGALVPCFEVPARADHVLAELQRRQLGPVLEPQAFDDRALERIHSPRYLRFLATAWDEWVVLYYLAFNDLDIMMMPTPLGAGHKESDLLRQANDCSFGGSAQASQ